jgi:chromosome segregation ATPase
LENEKIALKAQVSDWQREADIAKKHVELERQRCAELERVISQERRNLHERDLDSSSIFRENDELKSEIERLKLRIQSLQSHIDAIQKINGNSSNRGSVDLDLSTFQRVLQLEGQLQESKD